MSSTPLTVPIRRLQNGIEHGTPLPRYQTDHAAGLDIHACLAQAVTIAPGALTMIPAGFAMAVPVGYEAQVRPRSGLAAKHGVTLPNAPGTIDADYRGEVQIPLINHGSAPVTIQPNTRIAQMLITPVPRVAWQEVNQLPETIRGTGGFGHTGT